VILRLPVLLLTMASACVFAQDEFPGVYGKITSHPKAGDLAPEISFSQTLLSPGAEAWTTANLSGQVTRPGQPVECTGGTVRGKALPVRVGHRGEGLHLAAVS